jgi:DNA-directed RNA polymerase subunit M/transcription elongation factor TFIIS
VHSPGDRKTGAKKKVQIRDPEITKRGTVSKTIHRRASTQAKSKTRNPIAARLQRTAAKRKGGGKRKVVVDHDALRIERRRVILEKRREWLSKLRARFRKPDVAYILERACYDFAKDYSDAQNLGDTEVLAVYMDKVRDIERCAKDILFSEKIIASDFKTRMERLTEIRDIPYLRHDELDPLRWNELIRRKAMREEKLRNSQTTDMFKCRRCKARKSRVWWMQTRSADEPMTMFVQCVCCKATTRHN